LRRTRGLAGRGLVRYAAKGAPVARVLVVEDEESWADALSYMLRKEGFEVAVAATGPQALAEFDRSGADLVLLDLMLPQMSGVEVCRQLRVRSDVPIIMVSARDSEIDKVVGLEIGADDYVTKPYSLRELLAPSPWTSTGTWSPSTAPRYPWPSRSSSCWNCCYATPAGS